MSTLIKSKRRGLLILLACLAITHCSAMQKGLTKKQRVALVASLLAVAVSGKAAAQDFPTRFAANVFNGTSCSPTCIMDINGTNYALKNVRHVTCRTIMQVFFADIFYDMYGGHAGGNPSFVNQFNCTQTSPVKPGNNSMLAITLFNKSGCETECVAPIKKNCNKEKPPLCNPEPENYVCRTQSSCDSVMGRPKKIFHCKVAPLKGFSCTQHWNATQPKHQRRSQQKGYSKKHR